MPNPDEAREEAWNASRIGDAYLMYERGAHRVTWEAAWGARGQYDQQRIAALVKWAEDILNTGDIGLVLYERGEALLSALGQPEEVER